MAFILVVDDDPIDRMIVESLLRLDGHEIAFAEDGVEALAQYKQHPSDVVVTDLVMPKANGLRLIQDLLEFDPQARIIAITGSNPGPLFVAERYGAIAILTKPLQRDPFLSAVAAAAARTP